MIQHIVAERMKKKIYTFSKRLQVLLCIFPTPQPSRKLPLIRIDMSPISISTTIDQTNLREFSTASKKISLSKPNCQNWMISFVLYEANPRLLPKLANSLALRKFICQIRKCSAIQAPGSDGLNKSMNVLFSSMILSSPSSKLWFYYWQILIKEE